MVIKSKITEQSLQFVEKITGKMTLGKCIRSIRMCDFEEMSLGDFAAKLGISKQHLCDIERGRKSVSPALAAKYAKKLGYSEKQFIELALQQIIDRAKLKVDVQVIPKFSRSHYQPPSYF